MLDIETDGADTLTVVGVVKDGVASAFTTAEVPEWAWDALADPNVVKVCHSKFDVVFLRRHGYTVRGPVHDTLVMAWCLNENQFLDLGFLTKRYLGYDPDKRIRRHANVPWFVCDDGTEVPLADAPIDEVVRYNRRDIVATDQLYRLFLEELDQVDRLGYFLDEMVPFTSVLIDMEVAGMPIDVARTEALRDELEPLAAERKRALYAEAGLPEQFNIGSGDQLAAFLFGWQVRVSVALEYEPEVIECIKSCQSGEHEDCATSDEHTHENLAGEQELCTEKSCFDRHVVDYLPEGFVIESVGRTKVHGYVPVKGRRLNPAGVPMTESGSRPMVNTPTLMTHFASDPWVLALIEWRKLDKLLTTYLRKFPTIAVYPTEVDQTMVESGFTPQPHQSARIYGRFNQTGTKTGRLSSSEPNLQNIPARGDLGHKVRELFRGDLIVGDYSQLEPRLMAHFSQDPVLLDVYRNGRDIYLVTAEALFGREVGKDDVERAIAKTVFLGTQYGAGPAKLAQILALNGFPTDVSTAKAYLRDLERLYRVAYEWKDDVIAFARERGYVATIGGGRRRLRYQFKDRSNFKAQGYGERQAVNAVVQGSAGDIVRKAMVNISRAFGPTLTLVAQVHDELVWDASSVRTGRADVLAVMERIAEKEHGYDLSVPLLFEPHYGPSWADAKEGTTPIELPDEDNDDE